LELIIVAATVTFCVLCVAYLESDHRRQVQTLLNQHYAERKDLYDRLMARNLPEVKQAQAIRTGTHAVVSKRRNDMRIVEENRKTVE
jgi:DNA-binding transcriptional MocR family regulator